MDQFIDNAGCQLWTTVSGPDSAPAIMLVNGGPGCDDYLWDVAAMLDDRYRVIRFEPRGCGRSDRDGNYELETQVADLDAIRDAFGIERIVLIGHSYGPDVALAYALQHPGRVRGLVGIAGGRIVNDRDWSVAYHANKEARPEAYPRTFSADPDVNRIGNASWRAFIKRHDLLTRIAALDVPATYIVGTADIRPNWPIAQLAALMRAHYIEIDGAEHCIWMTHPSELSSALTEALARIEEHAS